MNKEERERYNAGLKILKLASTARTIVRKPIRLSIAKTIPDSVDSQSKLRKQKKHKKQGKS